MKHLIALLAVMGCLAAPAYAVNPDEVLDDPVLEERARDISAGLKCVVCRGENIDESNASIARDLRLLVRERLVEGDSNDQVVDFIVERYGEYVLMKPNRSGANLILWATGPVLFLIAGLSGALYLRRRAGAKDGTQALTQSEQARLNELLDE
ncbi:cytochrome c-type biogenesis protein CcmH [Aliiroseovarius halocynthiae]|uniref:Cytochrome c-type biogenesis protein n=1 Tax=Aliiroseovarius halocynthiae TaxID=985055 RepID=A0A545SUX3_9RHOB|nr:cytochrome c-type biogenesis protein [Aliiroseovarius halocynthiae]TQV68762.1 cytochrome c-type biogenesis protein CcmH [Aliiroseovarius halocynthiae]SMR71186.1 cytochrome c-type biogenesis protein CcmH [Aliiroseovarius halocynthiae]